MLKKTTLALLGLAASGCVIAGSMGPVCTPGNVTVPCASSQWDLGVQALYLRTLYDADKAYQHNIVPFMGYTDVANDWDWGYRLEGSYHFNTGNDITLTWVHYKDYANAGNLSGIIPITVGVVSSSTYTFAAQNELDQVNLVMGQHADFGLVKKMRFFGGLQYAHIRADGTSLYAQSPAELLPNITSVSQFDNTGFKGVGPVVGMDYSYDLSHALSLTANAAGSLLYGTSRINNGYIGGPSNLVFTSRYGTKKAVIPSLEAKLGVNYALALAEGVLNFEGGYQAMNYFNALQTFGVNGFSNTRIANSDFGLYGPYFGIKYLGNA